MKRSKREENSIIINAVFYTILVLVLVFIIVFYLMPNIKQIEIDKKQTINTYETLETIKKEGISFDEFKNLSIKNNENSKLVLEILKWIEEKFYDKNFSNNLEKQYSSFLINKEKELSSEESQEKILNNSKIISKVLPLYSEVGVYLWETDENYLTTYKFINYIESVLETFNLETKNSIWISHINTLDNYNSSEGSSVVTDSNIYSIPLNLKLSWTKKDIIQFLYYIENVWNIEVINNEIKLNNKKITNNWISLTLKWDTITNRSTYNIFEHQMIDINNISFSDYIDSSYEVREENFKNFIFRTQANDQYEISVSLEFYIKGLPIIEIENYINNVIIKYKSTLWLLNKQLKNTDIKWGERYKLTKQQQTLIQLKKEVYWFKKEMIDKQKIENVYKRSVEINKLITPIYNKLSNK